MHLKDELPYNIIVQNEGWEVFSDKSVKINQVIWVVSESHKKILLGSKGKMIKSIGINVREEIRKIYDFKSHLFLFVKVKENLLDDPTIFLNVDG